MAFGGTLLRAQDAIKIVRLGGAVTLEITIKLEDGYVIRNESLPTTILVTEKNIRAIEPTFTMKTLGLTNVARKQMDLKNRGVITYTAEFDHRILWKAGNGPFQGYGAVQFDIDYENVPVQGVVKKVTLEVSRQRHN
jgi:hypothetical protein